jgi:enoyl-CoA hydratase/carnithine racemase
MACDLTYGTENAAFAQPEIFTAQQAESLNIITQFVPNAEIGNFVDTIAGTISQLEVRDIAMCQEIVGAAVKDEGAGAELELRRFLVRAKEEKTQTMIRSFLKHGGQTEREEDFQGIFADVIAELSSSPV